MDREAWIARLRRLSRRPPGFIEIRDMDDGTDSPQGIQAQGREVHPEVSIPGRGPIKTKVALVEASAFALIGYMEYVSVYIVGGKDLGVDHNMNFIRKESKEIMDPDTKEKIDELPIAMYRLTVVDVYDRCTKCKISGPFRSLPKVGDEIEGFHPYDGP